MTEQTQTKRTRRTSPDPDAIVAGLKNLDTMRDVVAAFAKDPDAARILRDKLDAAPEDVGKGEK
jgi:hypothetical protein